MCLLVSLIPTPSDGVANRLRKKTRRRAAGWRMPKSGAIARC
jgi:hypothetical protein